MHFGQEAFFAGRPVQQALIVREPRGGPPRRRLAGRRRPRPRGGRRARPRGRRPRRPSGRRSGARRRRALRAAGPGQLRAAAVRPRGEPPAPRHGRTRPRRSSTSRRAAPPSSPSSTSPAPTAARWRPRCSSGSTASVAGDRRLAGARDARDRELRSGARHARRRWRPSRASAGAPRPLALPHRSGSRRHRAGARRLRPGRGCWPPAGGGAAAPVSHVLKVFLVDGAGRIRNVYSTGFLDARILVNDLLTVLAE